MKIILLVVAKTTSPYLQDGENDYLNRLKHYTDFEYSVIPALKNTKSINEQQQKTEEGKLILSKLTPSDFCILLDENGKTFRSENFAQFLENKIQSGIKRLFFVVGGPYGFSENVYQRADFKLSLSEMTFSHQMVRLIFLEQLYRAFTILKNEPYHHQ
ncbi:MAG: 23S rRNA (pseudouridine(1915)-N(3))-methyltransferase RlmH [Bacteroidales bacterium]|nr:23S rRNA (pseudouridine(1915)-N(3))-methyltransferase RlmH [Bacteroidales bacterium]